MAKQASLDEALLFDDSSQQSSKQCIGRRVSACALGFLVSSAFAFWIVLLLVYPIIRLTSESESALILLLFAAPVLLVSVLGTLYLHVKLPTHTRKKSGPRICMWTYPVWVDGSLGVVTAAEFLLIAAALSYCLWFMINFLIRDGSIVDKFMTIPRIRMRYSVWQLWTAVVGVRVGYLGLICMSLLFIPVTRGLSLFRIVDVPFEHAVRYHVWLGHLTMLLFTLHGLCYCLVWTTQGVLLEQLKAWPKNGVANLPGVIALVAGILLWMTSFGYVRKSFFELFFYTHQLYVAFVVFMAFHISDFAFYVCIAGIFLFMLDRFLRFLQSRRTVCVSSSRILPCGTMELVLPKPPGFEYKALSFVFLSVPKLSWLQWHPFSVSSSPYDSQGTVSFLIKPLGSWTNKLQNAVEETNKRQGCLFVNVEGPYGHESDYYLKYKSLVLVAGGIGVSPFVAILRDVLHRYNMCQDGLPEEVALIWAVKSRKELAMLHLVEPESICPGYSSRLKLSLHTYVTRECQALVEDAIPCIPEQVRCASKRKIFILAASSSYLLLAAYIIVTITGSSFVQLIMQKLLLDHASEEATSSSALRISILFLSMLSGVVIFGGLFLLSCHQWLPGHGNGGNEPEKPSQLSNCSVDTCLVGPWNTVYGQRPNLGELFDGFAGKWFGENVGVLVCGPETLQQSVATECKRGRPAIVFHYHSVSFDL